MIPIAPSPIRTDASNPFANHTMRVRLPSIARDVAARNPDYPHHIAAGLEDLAHALETDARIPQIDDPLWTPLLAARAGESWLNTEWFFAEVYFYRLIMEVTGWHSTRRDPFAPHKWAEIDSRAFRTALFAAFEMTPMTSARDLLAERLLRAMWGNRADLSLKEVAQHGTFGAHDDLLTDDRAAAIDRLAEGGVVHVIADNAGTELAMDCLLIDALLEGEPGFTAEQVVLHVKLHPTFVSDATHDDVLTLIAELGGRGRAGVSFGAYAAMAAERLQAALLEGRLVVQADEFWNSGCFLRDLSRIRPDLYAHFEGAALVIQKGDANYRRALDDTIWDADIPFIALTGYFPAPLLALRTLKSDPVVGLASGAAAALDAVDPAWRVNGRRAVASLGGRV
jgi:uncharacterized protein with ATP-grasp and redox domains